MRAEVGKRGYACRGRSASACWANRDPCQVNPTITTPFAPTLFNHHFLPHSASTVKILPVLALQSTPVALCRLLCFFRTLRLLDHVFDHPPGERPDVLDTVAKEMG